MERVCDNVMPKDWVQQKNSRIAEMQARVDAAKPIGPEIPTKFPTQREIKDIKK